MHWDGTSWTIVPTPAAGRRHRPALAVDAVALRTTSGRSGSTRPSAEDRSLILHWDGTSWSVVAHNCDTYGGLTGVTLLSPTDGWAVGDCRDLPLRRIDLDRGPQPAAPPEHNEIAYPLEDVSGVRRTTSGPSAPASSTWRVPVDYQSIAEHWDGPVDACDFMPPGQILYGVEAVAANDVWAVGTTPSAR